MLAFIRRAKDPQDMVVVCCNFTPVPRLRHRVGVPAAGWYREILNSDAAIYGGGNVGTHPGVMAEPISWQGRENSIEIKLPPLGVVMFKLESRGQPSDSQQDSGDGLELVTRVASLTLDHRPRDETDGTCTRAITRVPRRGQRRISALTE